MDKDKIEKYLSGMKGGEASYPFGPEALVYKVMGKMYALVSIATLALNLSECVLLFPFIFILFSYQFWNANST